MGEILEKAGLPTLVGGNIGVPVVSLIEVSTDATWSVLEVSSFQLESTAEFQPAIAVILNITPDHLDRHGSFENYIQAKERIFAAQDAQDCLVLNADNAPAAAAAARATSRVYLFSRKHPVAQGAWVEDGFIVFRADEGADVEKVMPLSGITLKGDHNVENVLAAVCAARLAGAPAEAVRLAIESFHAVEHRLEYVATLNGVEYYNDSKATNVDATAKAIAAFSNPAFTSSWAARIKARLHPADATDSGAGARHLHHRRSGCKNRVATARGSRQSSLAKPWRKLWRLRRCGPSRRSGAAGSGLLQL